MRGHGGGSASSGISAWLSPGKPTTLMAPPCSGELAGRSTCRSAVDRDPRPAVGTVWGDDLEPLQSLRGSRPAVQMACRDYVGRLESRARSQAVMSLTKTPTSAESIVAPTRRVAPPTRDPRKVVDCRIPPIICAGTSTRPPECFRKTSAVGEDDRPVSLDRAVRRCAASVHGAFRSGDEAFP